MQDVVDKQQEEHEREGSTEDEVLERSWANLMENTENEKQTTWANKMVNASEKQLEDRVKREEPGLVGTMENAPNLQEGEGSLGIHMMGKMGNNKQRSWGDMIGNILNTQRSWGQMMENVAGKQVGKGVWMQVLGMVRMVTAGGILAVLTIGVLFGIFMCAAAATLLSPILIPFLVLLLFAFTVALTLLGLAIAASSAYSSLPSLINHHRHRRF